VGFDLEDDTVTRGSFLMSARLAIDFEKGSNKRKSKYQR